MIGGIRLRRIFVPAFQFIRLKFHGTENDVNHLRVLARSDSLQEDIEDVDLPPVVIQIKAPDGDATE